MIKSKIEKYLELIEFYEGSDKLALSKIRGVMKMVGSDRCSISVYENLIVISVGKEWLHIYGDNDVRASTLDTFSRTMYLKTDIFIQSMGL